MGDKKFRSITRTPHKNCVSRKKTFMVAKIKLTPRHNKNRKTITKGNSKMLLLKGSPVINIIKSNGISEIPKLTNADITLQSGYIIFGIYTFVINALLLTIDPKPRFVASEKQLNSTIPERR